MPLILMLWASLLGAICLNEAFKVMPCTEASALIATVFTALILSGPPMAWMYLSITLCGVIVEDTFGAASFLTGFAYLSK
ncbi:hypothetical protein D3C80_1446620 [compost metagenome]